ncbi:MAG: Dabb family protein [Bacteroidota bacterium]
MKSHILLIAFLMMLMGCSEDIQEEKMNEMSEQLRGVTEQLTSAKETIASLKGRAPGKLVHMVFFKFKPNTNKELIETEIDKLSGIKGLRKLEYGEFKELGDSRAIDEYEFIMQMVFKDEAAYQAYQKDPIHLNLKKVLGPYMAGTPATYDYIID